MFSSDDQNIDICHKYSLVDRAEIPCNNVDTSTVDLKRFMGGRISTERDQNPTRSDPNFIVFRQISTKSGSDSDEIPLGSDRKRPNLPVGLNLMGCPVENRYFRVFESRDID
jgi:hypothetical protein